MSELSTLTKKTTRKDFMPFLRDEDTQMLFDEIDSNGDGRLSKIEMIKACQKIGIQVDTEIIDNLFSQIDDNSDGELDYIEFKKYTNSREKELQVMFDQMDVDGNGYIDETEMRQVLFQLGFKVSEGDLRKMFKTIDINSNGEITYAEFRRSFLLSPYSNILAVFEHWSDESYIDNGETSNIPNFGSESKWVKYLVAGGIAGSISRTCTAPLDRIKVLLQVTTSNTSTSSIGRFRNVITQIQGEGKGLGPFWKGNGVNVLKVAPETAVKFAVFERMKALICHDPKHPHPAERCMAGALAGMIAQLSIYPLETIKTRLMTSPVGSYKGISDAFLKIATKEGPRSLYRGLGASLLGVAPYAAIDLATYETLKVIMSQKFCEKDEKPGVLLMLGCGTMSSTMGATFAYPLALLRTRLQTQGMNGAPIKYKGITHAIQTIIKEEGPKALYKGLGPNLVKVVPAVGISYVAYEKSKNFLGIV